jgi:hypothetical protein
VIPFGFHFTLIVAGDLQSSRYTILMQPANPAET